MSRKKPVTKYRAIIKPFGTSARIVAFKEHIGRIAEVRILKEVKEDAQDVKRD